MNLSDAFKIVKRDFVYKSDGVLDSWKVTRKGDCDDFVTTVVWEMSDRKLLRFLWNMSFGPIRFQFCKAPSGYAHLIGVEKKTGLTFDVIQKEVLPLDVFKSKGYRMLFPMPFPAIWVKLAFGLIT